MSRPLTEIARFSAQLSQIHAPLLDAYLEYAASTGSDMDFVEGKMKEAVEKLRDLADRIEKWRG